MLPGRQNTDNTAGIGWPTVVRFTEVMIRVIDHSQYEQTVYHCMADGGFVASENERHIGKWMFAVV